jgi:hypothetical protein
MEKLDLLKNYRIKKKKFYLLKEKNKMQELISLIEGFSNE